MDSDKETEITPLNLSRKGNVPNKYSKYHQENMEKAKKMSVSLKNGKHKKGTTRDRIYSKATMSETLGKKLWRPFRSNAKSAGTAHSGWLWKELEGGKWEQCWFVLDGVSLSYYEHHTEKRKESLQRMPSLQRQPSVQNLGIDFLAEGERYTIDLKLIDDIKRSETDDTIFSIDLKDDKGSITLRTSNKKQTKKWCSKLKIAMEYAHDRVVGRKTRKDSTESGRKNRDGSSGGSFTSIGSFSFNDNASVASGISEKSSISGKSDRSLFSVSTSGNSFSSSSLEQYDEKDESPQPILQIRQKDVDAMRKYMKGKRKESKKRPYSTARGTVTEVTDVKALNIKRKTQVKNEEMNLPRDAIMPAKVATSIEDIESRKQKGAETTDLLKTIIQGSSFVKRLIRILDNESIIFKLVDCMYRIDTEKGQYLISEGKVHDTFFVVEEGKFNVLKRTVENGKLTKNESIVTTEGRGAYLGEVSLLYDQAATVSVRSVGTGVVWALRRKQFEEIRQAELKQQEKNKLEYLNAIFDLSLIQSDDDRQAFVDAVERHTCTDREVIVTPNSELQFMLFVVKGRMHVYDSADNLVHELNVGDCFGELALRQDYISEYKLVGGVASQETVYFRLDKQDFKELISPLRNAILHNFTVSDYLKSDAHIERKSEHEISESTKSAPVEYLSDTVMWKNDGTKSAPDEYLSDTVLWKNSAIVADNIWSSESVLKAEATTEAKHKLPVRAKKKMNIDFPWTEAPPLVQAVNFRDLRVLDSLGSGGFGKVNLVKLKYTSILPPLSDTVDQFAPEYFALKRMRIDVIVKMGWEKNVDNELLAMKELAYHAKSPFLLNCYHSFADQRNIYFLLELCDDDMFSYIGKRADGTILDEESTKFYSACVFSGLAAMHKRRILYRDLKPENLLLAYDGYIKIADFGFAKKTLRTFTICGTSDYMAPEIILGKGAQETADFWALGILIYEFLNGNGPFASKTAKGTYENILDYNSKKKKLQYRNPDVSRQCRSIIQKLLAPTKIKRYFTVGTSIDAYADHPFFDGFDWDRFHDLKMDAPYLPPPKDAIFEMLTPRRIKVHKEAEPQWTPDIDTNLCSMTS